MTNQHEKNNHLVQEIVSSKYKYVYLGGAIFLSQDAISWRKEAVKLVPFGWKVIDPLSFENDDYTATQLVELDYCLIRNSSAIIANISEPSWGTAMELAYARRVGVPAIGFSSSFSKFDSQVRLREVRDPATKPQWVPPWCAAHLSKFFPSLELACMELVNV